jgi:hypothetical protein
MNPLTSAKQAVKPIDRRPIYDWAAEHVEMPSVLTVQGKFNPYISRQLVAPFEALQNDMVRRVVICKPTRGGGTLLADVWATWAMAVDPGPCMFNLHTDTVARAHAETRLMPMFDRCGPIQSLINREDRHSKRKTSILFNNGFPLWIQGPSIGNLQARGVRYMVCDEIWDRTAWKEGRLEEALARLGDYDKIQNSKCLFVSQGGWKDDPLDDWWETSNQNVWTVECPSCHQHQEPVWRGVRDDRSRYGIVYDGEASSEESRVCESVRWVCKHCNEGFKWSYKLGASWNRTGKYEQRSDSKTVAGYRWNALIVRQFEVLAEIWCKASRAAASGDLSFLRTFIQKQLAEPWDESSIIDAPMVETIHLSDSKDWPEERFRLMCVDVQESELYYCVRGFDSIGNSRRLDFGVVTGHETIRDIQKKWSVPDNHTGVDAGFNQREVAKWGCEFGWILMKGADQRAFKHKIKSSTGKKARYIERIYSPPTGVDPHRGTGLAGRTYATLIKFSDFDAQDMVQRCLDGKTKVLWARNECEDQELETKWEKHLSGTKRKKEISSSGAVRWNFTKNPQDHFRDCEKMILTMATIKGLSI